MDNFVIHVTAAGIIPPALKFQELDRDAIVSLLRQALPLRTPYPAPRAFSPRSPEHKRRSRKTRELVVALLRTVPASQRTKVIELLLGEAARVRRSSDLWELADVHGIGLAMMPSAATVAVDTDGSVVVNPQPDAGSAVMSMSVFPTAPVERATWWSEMITPRESHVTLRLAEDVFVQVPIDDENEDVLMRLLAGATIRVRGIRGFEHVPGLEPNPVLREHVMAVLADA